MKVRVSTIPHSGMKIDAPIPLEPLNLRLQEGTRESDISFTAPPNADLTLTKTFGGAEVKGVISAPCVRMCSTCAENIQDEVVAEVSWVLQSLDEASAAPGDAIEDPGVLTYRGDHIDLEDPLQEALILTLTPFWHPPRDDQECCTRCDRSCRSAVWGVGEQEDQKRTLGSLLQGASVKAPRKR